MKSINELLVESAQAVSRVREELNGVPECSDKRHEFLTKLESAHKRNRLMVELYTNPFAVAHRQWLYRFGDTKPSPFAPR